MFRQFWSFLAVALAISSCLNNAECQSLSGVSWIYQGTAQQNNSALTFNLYDTLNLICKANFAAGTANALVFAVSKGTIPTGMSFSAGALTIKNIGTLIYSDVDGIKSGYENFIVYGTNYNTGLVTSLTADYRFVNVATLKTTDSATYVCSAGYFANSGSAPVDSTPAGYRTSGSLTVTVNTKSGQAHSARSRADRFVTYSAVFMGAFKLLI